MMAAAPALVAQLTPQGRGAVATLAVWGPGATTAVASYFLPAGNTPLEKRPIGQIVFGRWGGEDGEEVVVCRKSAANVEIHCHGGVAAAARIAGDLRASGCTSASWQEWAGREEPTATRAEARIALASARTATTAAILLDQHLGALDAAVEDCCSLLDQEHLDEACGRLERLLSLAPLGLHLAAPWRVVLAGKPNVGKSSLINALLGFRRAIVLDQPGTTRDAVSATTALDGWPVELTDTAGLHDTEGCLEAAGIAQARRTLAAADAVLHTFDATEPWSPEDEELLAAWPRALRVYNKSDLAPHPSTRQRRGIRVSALEQTGLETLVTTLMQTLVPVVPEPGEAVPFTRRHQEALTAARERLGAEDFQEAKNCLRRFLVD